LEGSDNEREEKAILDEGRDIDRNDGRKEYCKEGILREEKGTLEGSQGY
jgi:hypothetical protein